MAAEELNGWIAIKDAFRNSATLTAYVKSFVFYDAQARIFQPGEHPVLMAWPASIPNDDFRCFPKRKLVTIQIIVTGVIVGTGEALINELLHFDALIKNAAETDITLGGKAIIVNIGKSTFHGLSEGVAMVQIPALITLPLLTAGNR
jgi:hypothetical protein